VNSPLIQAIKARKAGVGLAAAVALILCAVIIGQRYNTAEGSVRKSEIFTVREGPLTISITEAGTIQAKDQIILKSEVEGQAQIIFLIEEGTEVEEGELLVELDSSQLVDSRVDQEIQVQNKEADFISARENLEVVKNQSESDVSAAELAYQFAKEDLAKYVDGDHPMAIKEAEAKIALAKSDQSQTREQLEGSNRLLQEGFLTSIEFDQHKSQAERAELDLQLAEASMALLREYTYTRRMTELRSAIEETERALTRAKLKANADVVQAEARLRASESEYERQKERLTKLDEQIIKTKIFAPAAGLAIHATTADGGGWQRRNEPLAEGQSVRERQELIYLPTASQMTAEVQVHESNLKKIRTGLGVLIKVDALPGRTFTGHVTRIAPLPDAQSAFMNPDLKVYRTRIDIEGTHPELRTGMTCESEIMIARFDSALYVPVQSVFIVNGNPTAFLSRPDGSFEQRVVEMGLDNNRMLQIASGLDPGDKVLMTPPLDLAALAAEDSGDGTGSKFVDAREAPVQAIIPPGRPTDDNGAERAGREGSREGGGEGGREGREGREGGGEGGREGRGGGGDMTDEERAAMRERFQNMTEEERAKAREERMKNMTPEERAQWEQRRQQRGDRDGQSQ